MRAIKFRGKRIDKDEWVYGLFPSIGKKYSTIHSIFPKYEMDYRVESKTIGQFTGLLDKQGKEIYEGDIVRFEKDVTGKIMWGNERMAFFFADEKNIGMELGFIIHCREGELPKIIGNIYENPELLK